MIVWSHVFVPELVPVISEVIATVPSLSGKVQVLAAVVAFVKKFVNVFAAFLKFILNRVIHTYPQVASLFAACSALSAKVPCAAVAKLDVDTKLSLISFPVVVSKAAKLESTAEAGHTTSQLQDGVCQLQVPSQSSRRNFVPHTSQVDFTAVPSGAPQALSSTYFLVAACRSVVGVGTTGELENVFIQSIVSFQVFCTALSAVAHCAAVA